MAPKTLLVFCDGTGQDGTLAVPNSASGVIPTPGLLSELEGSSNTQYATNVLRLARSVRSHDKAGNRQIVLYQSGVASETSFSGDPIAGITASQALGTAVASKIRDAYVFIAQNYEAGDSICLFGFSRGAYTARKLAGLIDAIGLLSRQNLGHLFEIWRQLIDKETPIIPSDTRRPNIKCVGVWDTVGSVYGEIDALNIVDTSLPAIVKLALHGISLQENRKRFLPTLWTPPPGGLQADQVLKQIWFSGAHSDVGGGYERHELADISVYWMAGEIKDIINLDLEFLRSYGQARPDAWGTSQPHNAYIETPILVRPILGQETRLESGQLTQGAIFHQSVQFSPQQLHSPEYMVTTSLIQRAWGSSFSPQYAPMNDFETYCRNNWGTGVSVPPHAIENPNIVVRPRVHWTHAELGVVPSTAILGGNEADGRRLYLGRAPYEGGIYPGKVGDDGHMYIGFGGVEVPISEGFELLIGRQSAVRWVAVVGEFTLEKLGGAVPVRGGTEVDREPIFIARAAISSGLYPGRVKLNGNALIPLDGKEDVATAYDVLVYEDRRTLVQKSSIASVL